MKDKSYSIESVGQPSKMEDYFSTLITCITFVSIIQIDLCNKNVKSSIKPSHKIYYLRASDLTFYGTIAQEFP